MYGYLDEHPQVLAPWDLKQPAHARHYLGYVEGPYNEGVCPAGLAPLQVRLLARADDYKVHPAQVFVLAQCGAELVPAHPGHVEVCDYEVHLLLPVQGEGLFGGVLCIELYVVPL